MRKILCLLLSIGLVLLGLSGYAQDRTITGKVTSRDDNKPLAGVTVRIKGTNRATTTDDNGFFKIQAKTGDVIQLTQVGAEAIETTVSSDNTVNIRMNTRESVMGEVVVAMDIKRNPRELGYSVQKIGGTEIAQTQRENFVNSLQGRVAGLTITPTTGLSGASSQIVLRGFNSLSLSNQPLFIVDGVMIDNSTLNETSNGGADIGLATDRANRNNDYTNRIADINPNDIESVTILKGAEATVLYGSQASSGAIVITTKKASATKGINIFYDDAFRTQTLTRFNQTISDFSTGSNGVFSPNFTNSNSFFGPAYPADTRIYDNVHQFFRTGFTQEHNLSTDFGTKASSFRISGSLLDQKGVVPTNDYKKYNLRLTNTTRIGKILTITPSISYFNNVNDKPLRGAGGYLLNLYAWPSDNDISNWQGPGGGKVLINPADLPNSELDNPYFNTIMNKSRDKTERYFATLGVDLNPFSWLTLAGRFGYDTYKTEGYTFYHPQSSEYGAATGGEQDNYYKKYEGYNHTITATARKSMGKFSGRLMIGTMWQDNENKGWAVAGNHIVDSINKYGQMMLNGQVVTNDNFNQVIGHPGDSNITRANTRVRLLRNVYGEPNLNIFRNFAYFAEGNISYNNVLFLTYSHRFEQASVFPKAFRKYDYPGLSFSAIVSDMIPALKSNNTLNYWKLRASLAQTARLPDPYSNQAVFINSTASGGGFTYGFTNNNEFLSPELQKTYEIGTEMRLFSNRLTIDLGYYNTKVSDQIIQGYRASYATGFVLNTSNVGSTRNRGIELSLGFTPIRSTDWSWNMLFNFNKMYSKVLSLPPSLTEYYSSDTQVYGSARAGLHVGGPTTTITGYHYARNNAGSILINPANGLPVVATDWITIGDRNPDFTLGWTNNISYKNWNLSFLWDLKVGGDIYNGTDAYLTAIGKSVRTADRKMPRVVTGVLKDGRENTANPTANTIVINPYYQNDYYTSMPDEEFVEKNVNWFRLRDLTLSYTFPAKTMHRIKYLKSLGFFVTGDDLIMLTNYSGADPAVNINTSSNRGIGGFGMDFGSLPTPVSVNVGVRASF